MSRRLSARLYVDDDPGASIPALLDAGLETAWSFTGFRPSAGVTIEVVVGSRPQEPQAGDSYDNALAETMNGNFKTELVRGPARPGPWKTVEDLERATLGWVHWHNTERLHGYLGDIPPAEFEQALYAGKTTINQLVEIK